MCYIYWFLLFLFDFVTLLYFYDEGVNEHNDVMLIADMLGATCCQRCSDGAT